MSQIAKKYGWWVTMPVAELAGLIAVAIVTRMF